MFDVSWSEILIVGIVALLVVGPKELPALLRTIGKYAGIVKRHAAEFRAQFDEAMRESELEQLRKDVESVKSDAETVLRDAERSVETDLADAKREIDTAAETAKLDQPETGTDDGAARDANGSPPAPPAAANGGAGQEMNGAAVGHDPSGTGETLPKSGA